MQFLKYSTHLRDVVISNRTLNSRIITIFLTSKILVRAFGTLKGHHIIIMQIIVMLSSFMLIVIMQSDVRLIVVMLNVIMFSVAVLNVIMVSAIMLYVTMLRV